MAGFATGDVVYIDMLLGSCGMKSGLFLTSVLTASWFQGYAFVQVSLALLTAIWGPSRSASSPDSDLQ